MNTTPSFPRASSSLDAGHAWPEVSIRINEAASLSTPKSPFFFGDLARSCGDPSHHDDEHRESHSGSGCFGITRGGGGSGGGSGGGKPKTTGDDEDTTALIAKSMNQLSLQDREMASEDIHGVSAAVRETPAFIQEAIHKMEDCLQATRHKPAYDMAQTIKADYVHDPKLLIMFLRADRFNAEQAATRFVKFLDWKLNLFGRQKLCQRVDLDDLDVDARFMVESGIDQVLPERDSRGRAITVVAIYYLSRFFRSSQSLLQMTYYFGMSVVEDETNQISGLVSVCYGLGPEEEEPATKSKNILHSTWESASLMNSLPIRIEATHFCSCPHSGMHFVLKLLAKSIGLFNRARLRIHLGSHLD
jgi:hypothetical protein